MSTELEKVEPFVERDSPTYHRVVAMLKGGQHPYAVVDAIRRTEGVELPLAEVVAVRESLNIEEGWLSETIGDVITDPIADLHVILRAERNRLEFFLKQEQATGKRRADVADLIHLHVSHLMSLAELMNKANQWGDAKPDIGKDISALLVIAQSYLPQPIEVVEAQYTEVEKPDGD